VVFHACVAMAVLGGGDDGESPTTPRQEAVERVTATPTPLVNRANCTEIRGTDYRSETERIWFQANCV
jgi:hypothetical protein